MIKVSLYRPRPSYRNAVAVTLACAGLAAAGVAGIPSREEIPTRPPSPRLLTAVDAACADPIFELGRPLGAEALRGFSAAKYRLSGIEFRDVIFSSPNAVELAYRTAVTLRPNASARFLVPEHKVACREGRKGSERSDRLSRSTIPVLGDLHLPSTRVTIFDARSAGASDGRDQLYNYPRISDVSLSSEGYFSFSQNWVPYRKTQTLSEYADLLRDRALFSRVELRELSEGRIGIYAERDYSGERAQLLIILTEQGGSSS